MCVCVYVCITVRVWSSLFSSHSTCHLEVYGWTHIVQAVTCKLPGKKGWRLWELSMWHGCKSCLPQISTWILLDEHQFPTRPTNWPFQPWPTGYQGSCNEIKRLAGWTRHWPQVEPLVITTLSMKDGTMTNRCQHVISESRSPRTSQRSEFQCFPLVPTKSPLILRCNWKSEFQSDKTWSFDICFFYREYILNMNQPNSSIMRHVWIKAQTQVRCIKVPNVDHRSI